MASPELRPHPEGGTGGEEGAAAEETQERPDGREANQGHPLPGRPCVQGRCCKDRLPVAAPGQAPCPPPCLFP